MPAKLRVAFLTLAWLTAFGLVILGFAEIITPHPTKTSRTNIQIVKTTPENINKEHEITLRTPEHSIDIHASISIDARNRNAIINSLKLPGNLEDIHIDTDRELAFLANSFSGLQIVDISDLENLRILGTLQDVGKAWEIVIFGNILYLASSTDGLFLIDISSVENPVIVSRYNLEGHYILDLTVRNNTVYAITGKKGLLIIDVSEIKSPKLIKKLYTDKGAWGLLTDKNWLFVSNGRDNLDILDITDPTNPNKTGEVFLPDRAWDMVFYKNVLYMPTRKAGLLLIDFRRKQIPKLLQTATDLVDYEKIYIQRDQAFIASRTGSLTIFDIANPVAPKLVKTVELPDRPRAIAISDGTFFVAGGLAGLQVIKTNNMVANDQVVKFKVPGTLKKMLFDGNFYYLVTRSKGLFIAEVNESGEPGAIVAHLLLDETVNNMLRVGNHLYLAGSQGSLLIVNISRPTAPSFTGKFRLASTIRDLVAFENQLFLADSLQGILVVDIEDPANPELINKISLQDPKRLAVDSSNLYVSTSRNLNIFKHQTSGTLNEVSNLEFPWPLQEFTIIKQLIVTGKVAYIAAGPAGLLSLDISDSKTPRFEEIITLDGDILAVNIAQNNIVALTRQGKLWFLQRGKDNKLTRHTVVDNLGIGYNIMPYGNHVLIANGIKGMTILPLPQQLDRNSRTKTPGRVDNEDLITLNIPLHTKPGIYNLNILSKGEFTEFIGAVQINKK